MNKMSRYIFIGMLILFSTIVHAKELLMVRSVQPFPETMSTLQETIRKHGYTVSRVQRVDIGLTKMGYKTDKYRIVFYGKADEYKTLTKNHPELIPFLPLKIAIFSENNQTLMVAYNPLELSLMFENKELQVYFERWAKDMTAIMTEVQQQTVE